MSPTEADVALHNLHATPANPSPDGCPICPRYREHVARLFAAWDAEHQREVEALRAESDKRVEGNDYVHRALSQAKDRENLRLADRAETAERDRDKASRELADLRAKVAETRAGIWRLGESIHGDEGVEHVEGCEGEPTCFACILADLRALLPTEDDQP